jgi:hypothetical protein
MGFIVSQSIYSSNWGELDSFYTRIENYRFDKITGRLDTTVMCYIDSEKAKLTYAEFIQDPSPKSYLIGGLVEYNSSSIDINDYNYFEFYLTSSVEVIEDLFEESWVSESFTYTDFDDDGNLIEIETTTTPELRSIKVGEILVTKIKIDLSPITGSIYSYGYERVMEEYSKIFGSENIIEDI